MIFSKVKMKLFQKMPLRLDIRRELTARSDRIKSVDLHPSEPWLLCSLYSGHVHVWNTQSQVDIHYVINDIV